MTSPQTAPFTARPAGPNGAVAPPASDHLGPATHPRTSRQIDDRPATVDDMREPKHEIPKGPLADRVGRGLLPFIAVLLAIVVGSPIALSSGELMRWARALSGLALDGFWPWLVIGSLDAAAIACVLIVFYCAIKGKAAGIFSPLTWVFAVGSAVANYRHGIANDGPHNDAVWFFPFMSLIGPGMLEAVTWMIRREIQKGTGARSADRPKFGIARWLPFVGAPKDTYGAYRTAQVLNITTVAEAVATYHELCPNGSVQVVAAIRARDVARAEARVREEARAARAADPTARAPRADTTGRARAPEPKSARAGSDARTAKTARARGPEAARAVTDARAENAVDALYARYADAVDQRGEELTTDDIMSALAITSDGHARRVRGQLAARYAEEFTARTRTPRDGVTLPARVQTAIAARAQSTDVTGELARITAQDERTT